MIKSMVIGGVTAFVIYAICVWLSGWQFERGTNAVVIFTLGICVTALGAAAAGGVWDSFKKGIL